MLMATKRNYLTVDELATRLGITIETDERADYEAKIDLAEQQIDAYVGAQEKFLGRETFGEVIASLTGKVIDDQGNLGQTNDYFKGALLEIIGGTGAGQIRTITSSDRDEQSVSFSGDPFGPALDGSSAFKIYQLGKFPRRKDASTNRAGTYWYKTIPEAVKAAVAAQVEFIDGMGLEFFSTDKSEYQAERIGNYSYQKGSGAQTSGSTSVTKMIGPKAKALLSGIRNATGQIVAGPDSWA